MAKLSDIPLREKKFAQTKLSLLNAAIEAIKYKTLDDISVRELCETAFVSEGTFFNYFSKKTDLLIYFIQLWSIEVAWRAEHTTDQSSGLKIIEKVFELTAKEQIMGTTKVLDEIISYLARVPELVQNQYYTISLAEKLMAFPDLEGIENMPDMGLIPIFQPLIQRAIKKRELPKNTDIKLALVALYSMFFGVRLFSRQREPEKLAEHYQAQLQLLWKGLKRKV
jgi:AcrR family transcriptional regulator